MPDTQLHEELIKKYRWAGKIRLISFALLFVFLLMMKFVGGFSYLNPALYVIIFVEALFNQPYGFLLNRVNMRRFQYFQMLTDIIAISWVLYYVGGLEAPAVSLAYYAVILWAGVVAGFGAVLFAVIACAFFFSSVVLLEQFGIFPRVSFLNYSMPTTQVVTILMGNVAFLFAFGYFSVRSSEVIRLLQRKRQEELLRYTHRLQATGYLMSESAHDIQGCLAGIKAGVQVVQSLGSHSGEEKKFLASIEDFEKKGSGLVQRLAKFAREPERKYATIDIHTVIDDALALTDPLIKYSKMSVKKEFRHNLPFIIAQRNQIQEVFVAVILNSLDAVSRNPAGGTLTIKTECFEEGFIEVIFSDTGIGISQDDVKRVGELFFDSREPGQALGLGLAVAYDIIARHNGKIEVTSENEEGTMVIIRLSIVRLPSAVG